jgi:hypothetical protein
MKYLFIALLLITGCGAHKPIISAIPELPDYEKARYATLDAWERIIDTVPKECRVLTSEYSIVEVVDLPSCGTNELKPGTRFIGCVHHKAKYIEIAIRDQTALARMDVAVHEYIHILIQCVTLGYNDPKHLHPLMWTEHGHVTVEAYGCAGY